jgi:hypothetical protein
MKVVGLDIAKSSGVAFVTRATPPSSWRCLALQSEEKDVWAAVDEIGETLAELLAKEAPDFAVIERPIDVIVDHGAAKALPSAHPQGGPQKRMINATTTITLSALVGNTIGTLNALKIPFGIIAAATWRSWYFGKGTRPENGDWKALSVSHAERLGVVLPPTKKARMDAAEAVGIACAWERVTFVPKRHQAAFVALRTGRIAA